MPPKLLRRPGTRLTRILASNIQSYRQRNGLSQEEMAALCGLHRTYVGSVEREERNVTLSTLEVFAKTIGLSVAELLTPQAGQK
jgi:transcriptional regulator with XRE-family HTH domain